MFARQVPQTGTILPPNLSLAYGFYAEMGGIVVNVKDIHHTFAQLTLTHDGVLVLARHGQFMRIPNETIEDKSKSNLLGKILVTIQAVWMIIQCAARARHDLSLTILELHTLIHVCFALVMYFFWLKV